MKKYTINIGEDIFKDLQKIQGQKLINGSRISFDMALRQKMADLGDSSFLDALEAHQIEP